MKEQHTTLLEKPAYWDVKKKCLALAVLVFALIGVLTTGSHIAQVLLPSNTNPLEIPVGLENPVAGDVADASNLANAPAGSFTITTGGKCLGKKSIMGSYEVAHGTVPQGISGSYPKNPKECQAWCNRHSASQSGCLGFNWIGKSCFLIGQLNGSQRGSPYTALKAPTERPDQHITCGIASGWGRRN